MPFTPPLTSSHGGKIVHVAIQTDNHEATARMYRDLFRFRDLGTFDVKNLTATWLYDGHIYLSVVSYHDDSTAESRAVSRAPCIHHLGLESKDPGPCSEALLADGCTLVSPPGEMPIKLLTADRIMIEIAPEDYFAARFLRGKGTS
jgi:4-hydroxyphenylpyruvate dioxygenase-like putative hemolysin